MSLLKIGIIGTGGIAGGHAKGYKSFPTQCEIVACCDLVEERTKRFAAEHGFERTYSSFEEMLKKEDLDVVSVCTPNYAHAKPAITALKKGVHVLVEKPMAMNVKEAEAMIAAAKAGKALLSVGHHMRFEPPAQVLKRFVDAGELGEVYFARSQSLRRRGIPTWGAFHIKEKSGGGTLIDIGVHALDLTLWLMGHPEPDFVVGMTYNKLGTDPELVNSWGKVKHEEFDVDDFACGYVRFKNGASLMIESSWAANIKDGSFTQEVVGTKGGATLHPLAIHTQKNGALVDITPRDLGNVHGQTEEIRNFLGAIRKENELLVKAEQCLLTQRIMDGIYKSTETGKPVALSGKK